MSDVRVRSASAPDEVELTDDVHAVIRVGSPSETVSGRHRYVLEYRITGAVDDGRLAVDDAIGTGWEVPINTVDIRLTIAAGGSVSVADLFTAGIVPGLLLAAEPHGHRVRGGCAAGLPFRAPSRASRPSRGG